MFNKEISITQIILSPIIILTYLGVMYFIGHEEAICLFKSDIWQIMSLVGMLMVLCPWVCFSQGIKTSFAITFIGAILVVFGIGIKVVGWGWALILVSILLMYFGIFIQYSKLAVICIISILVLGIFNRNSEVTPEKKLPPSEELYKNEPDIKWLFYVIKHCGVDIKEEYTFIGTRDQLIQQMNNKLNKKVTSNSNPNIYYTLGEYMVCGVPKDVALKYGDIEWARDQKYRHFNE